MQHLNYANKRTRLCLSVLLAGLALLLAGRPANRNSGGETVGTGEMEEQPPGVGGPDVALSETHDGMIVFDADPRPGGSTVLAAIYDPDTGMGGATAVCVVIGQP
jgi:hypothetical protein